MFRLLFELIQVLTMQRYRKQNFAHTALEKFQTGKPL